MSYWLVFFLILFLVGGGLVALLIYSHRAKTSRPLFENLTLMVLALFVVLMGMEFYFKVFFAQPDALITLAEQNWRNRYYTDAFNSSGYRDVEWTDEMVENKTGVMVVGDSFVEGVGIEYPEDRFPDRLAQKLGPDYVVFNLGKRRANTVQEIQAIVNYPYRPDILILSYFVNDIEDVRWWYRSDTRPTPSETVPTLLLPLVQNSYAFNFVYWRFVRLYRASQPDVEWLALLRLYNDPGAWWLHQQDLLSIYKGTQAEQIPLIVVVFPSMNRLEDSLVVTERVIDLFEEQGVTVLNVADLIEGTPTSELVASPVDPHPSEFVHKLVADALYKKLVQLGYAQTSEVR